MRLKPPLGRILFAKIFMRTKLEINFLDENPFDIQDPESYGCSLWKYKVGYVPVQRFWTLRNGDFHHPN